MIRLGIITDRIAGKLRLNSNAENAKSAAGFNIWGFFTERNEGKEGCVACRRETLYHAGASD
jgi:hypothetical protein